MVIPEAIRNNVVSGLIGAALTWLATRVQSKTVRLRYWARVERIATSSSDPIFGTVAVTWGGNPSRNLFLATVEVENTSSRDFQDVPFRVYTEVETFLLNERTSVVNTPHIVPWTQEFRDSIAVRAGATPTTVQENRYYHGRDYRLPVLNRGQLLQFIYLCSRPNDDMTPQIFIDTQLVGARMRREDRSQMFFGVPNRDAMIHGLIVSTLLVVLCGWFVHRTWLAIAISYVVGLTVLAIGWAEYKAVRWIRNLIVG